MFGKNKKELADAEKDFFEQTNKEAQHIIETASKKAEQIIRETHFFTRQVRSDLRKSLLETSEQVAKQSQAQMDQILAEYEQNLKSLLQKIETKSNQYIDQFGKEAGAKIQALEEHLEKEMLVKKTEFETILTAQKEQQFARLTASLKKKLPDIIKDLVGRSIPLGEQEKIVEERLQQIKEANVWK